jgi:hypothetical protein
MNVYKAINAVQTDLCKHGIGKDSENTFDNYKFRGIDAVYNALAPLLAKHGLCVLPRMLTRTCEERQSQKGGALFYVTVEAEFDFVAAEDGSKHTVRTFGEAMDRGDKATNKAMSAAYKYAAFQAFAIPTEGDNDADATTHEVAHAPQRKANGALPGKSDARPTSGVEELVDEEQKTYLQLLASVTLNLFKQPDGIKEICDRLDRESLDSDCKVYYWSLLPSNVRSAIKREQEARHATPKEQAKEPA